MPVQSAAIINNLIQDKPAAFQFFPLPQHGTCSSPATHEETVCSPNGQRDFPEIFPVYPFI